MYDTISTDVRPSRSERSTSPFLVKAGTPRSGEDQLPGYYCEQQKMWVVDTEQGALPIIDVQVLSQLTTKTRADKEEVDDACLALELTTKTAAKRESDDEFRLADCVNLSQLVMKTDSAQEGDDNFTLSPVLELVTKTKVQQEADDDGSQCFRFDCCYKNISSVPISSS